MASIASNGLNSLEDLVNSLGLITDQNSPDSLKLLQIADFAKQKTNDPRTDVIMSLMQSKAMSTINQITAPDHSSDSTKADQLTSAISAGSGFDSLAGSGSSGSTGNSGGSAGGSLVDSMLTSAAVDAVGSTAVGSAVSSGIWDGIMSIGAFFL